jgi:protein TonB
MAQTHKATPRKSNRDSSDRVFTKAQKQAYFPGGMDGWNKYLSTNLKYPQQASQYKVEGTVNVQIIVEKDGSLSEVKMLNDPGYELGKEAVRLLQQGPKWIPAEQNGQKVTNRLVIPVVFKLS